MGRSARDKGCRGELEFAELLRAHGWPARRGCQSHLALDKPDILDGPDGWHLEVKRCERLNIVAAFDQARRDADRRGGRPAVAHRRNRSPWLVTVTATDFLAILSELTTAAVRAEGEARRPLEELTAPPDGGI